ncbi:hypothetical protein MHU86_8499 [Fragilaria crotonensis]|nr:hypothetical protein MHU86_8499 [Fragilaria crotonensis]
MEYSQVKYSRFISPTTCYSGLRALSENGLGSFATESDSIHCLSTSNDLTGQSLSDVIRPISVDLPCVGHACLQTQEAFVFLEKKRLVAQNGSSSVTTTLPTNSEFRSSFNRSQSLVITDEVLGSETMSAPVQSAATTSDTVGQQGPDASVIVWKNVDTSYKIRLPCRLLAPTFSKVGDDHNILWAGSADDSELRCFQIYNQEIQSVKVPKLEAVMSPIMSIDCYDDEKQHSLALGCQDGTVCIMSFSCQWKEDQISLETLTTHNVIVDGPIMSLHLTKTRLLLGSMCGYVCQLLYTGDVWEEPSMVVEQFLWDSRYEADDAVLAVEYWMDRIVLGTYSGLVQIHVPVGKTMYAVEWSCRAPDAVHAIAHFQNKLVVTTRTSMLMFEAKATYSAERAKNRLQKILDTNRLSLF